MYLLLWITVGFIIIGFVVLISMKKGMEIKVALLKENAESANGKQISSKPVIWWIWGATAWGVVSIFLIVWLFSVYAQTGFLGRNNSFQYKTILNNLWSINIIQLYLEWWGNWCSYKKSVKQRRYYDKNGKVDLDIDYRIAGKYKFPHRHTWSNGKRSGH